MGKSRGLTSAAVNHPARRRKYSHVIICLIDIYYIENYIIRSGLTGFYLVHFISKGADAASCRFSNMSGFQRRFLQISIKRWSDLCSVWITLHLTPSVGHEVHLCREDTCRLSKCRFKKLKEIKDSLTHSETYALLLFSFLFFPKSLSCSKSHVGPSSFPFGNLTELQVGRLFFYD